MTKSEFIAVLMQEVKGLSSYLDASVDYSNATDDALRETGWAFPVTSDFKIYWLKQRAKRHLFFYLFSESAHKFKIKTLNLNQRFDHYKDLISMMDEAFVAIQESEPQQFAGVDSFNLFGTKVDAGFSYDSFGRDTTYSESNKVKLNPNEDS